MIFKARWARPQYMNRKRCGFQSELAPLRRHCFKWSTLYISCTWIISPWRHGPKATSKTLQPVVVKQRIGGPVTVCHSLFSGSNDKSVCTWSLGSFSQNDDLEPACNPLVHFALGDLEVHIFPFFVRNRCSNWKVINFVIYERGWKTTFYFGFVVFRFVFSFSDNLIKINQVTESVK